MSMTSEKNLNTGTDAIDRYLAAEQDSIEAGVPDTLSAGIAATDTGVFARCDAAIALTPRLAKLPEIAWAFDEARELARKGPRQPARPESPGWLHNAGLAWGAAGMLTVALIVTIVAREQEESANGATAAGETYSMEASQASATATTANIDFAPIAISTELARMLAEVRPVVLLADNTPVDSRSLAILPFTASFDAASQRAATISAASIYNQVLRQLSDVPGIYLIDPSKAAVYADTGLTATEIAQQLGVRGIIEGNVASINGAVQFNLSFTDAATIGTSLNQSIERSSAEVGFLQTDIAASVLNVLARTPPPDPPDQLL
jgi:TolB-like protein